MKTSSFLAITTALRQANVRYIIVGGLAVIAHGYLRATRDADIVLELVPENIHAAFDALDVIGFKPTLPVTAAQFAVPSIRKSWREQKNMQVLQFWADTYPDLKLDVFIEHPFDFENEWNNAKETKFGKGQNAIRVVDNPRTHRNETHC